MRKKVNWDEIFNKYAEQQLSDSAFCKQESISGTAFYREKKNRGIARRYRKKEKACKFSAKPEIVELQLASDAKTSRDSVVPTLRLSNAKGLRIEVFL